MRRVYPIRLARRGLRGLGAPILPDQFVTAAGVSESFSPGTADATMVAILQSQGQSLPADLAAKMAAAQTVTPATQVPAATTSPAPVTTANPTSSATSTPAVTASGQPISTQTAAPVTLVTTIAVAPGVWQYVMSDGSSHYADQNGNPVSYTPPAATPATTPAAGSQPAAPVTVIAVTPSGGQISTTTGTTPTTPATTTSDTSSFVDEFTTWLEASMFAGIPNWVLLGGGVVLFMMMDEGKGSRRR